MADFSDELDGYLKARTATELQERQETAAANAAADALFGHTFAFPHPQGFHSTQEAPAFAQHPVTQMWHDATTGTFSYYDAESETYIPVEGPDASHPHAQRQQKNQYQQEYHLYTGSSYDSPGNYHVDPNTGYLVDISTLGVGADQMKGHYEAPPESDATLRLCVLSSNVLKVGGVILMDASGLSFGRDRPLSGQGKRVRMVEMEISRFHGSIYLDRQQVMPVFEARDTIYSHTEAIRTTLTESQSHESHLNTEELKTTDAIEDNEVAKDSKEAPLNVEDNASKQEENNTILPKDQLNNEDISPSKTQDDSPSLSTLRDTLDQEAEDGEISDTPSPYMAADTQEPIDREQGEMSDDEENGQRGSQALKDKGKKQEDEEQHRQYREYQRQMEEYQQYYQSMAPPVYMDTFQIIDCGSTHGTFLNGQRLSSAKTASQPFPLHHLDQLQLGSTVFEIHAHEEGRICASCQVTDDNEIEVLDDKDREIDGNRASGVDANGNSSNKNSPKLMGDIRLSREQERVEEMNRLRKKWASPDRKATGKRTGGNSGGYQDGSSASSPSTDYGSPSGYVDRAAKRRQFNPDTSQPVRSGPDYSSTPEITSGFHVPVAKTNKGHAMLSKMGWKAGTGLGASSQGVTEPVQLMVADRKAGLGSKTIQSQGAAAIAASRPPETQAEIARRKARERYARLQ
ncbi:hypothetical protein FBU30_010663 [Linnemannia zychae]|nr:hypothetical protein FBU30_010663 [Linnemannia zychae]